MLARIVNMRGVDLNRFDFDYDLTWVGFFMNANAKVYGRYGGRDAGPAEAHLSLAGLKVAMRAALESYRRDPTGKPTPVAAGRQTVESYPAAQRVKDEACIHCHQVYDFRREALRAAGTWTRDQVWVYPPPQNLGITLDDSLGAHIRAVAADSPAGRAGLRAGDALERVNDLPVASFADVQYALHRAPATGTIPLRWKRDGRTRRGAVTLPTGWRESDISWRASMWGLPPGSVVWGPDLSAEEKRAIGLGEKALAFRQARPLTKQAREAGIHEKDIIVGLDDRRLEMTFTQFAAFIRLNYKVGDVVRLRIIRDGEPMDLPLTLQERDGF